MALAVPEGCERMTLEEMSNALERFCDERSCDSCPLFQIKEIRNGKENCYSLYNNFPVNVMRNYNVVFGEPCNNPYWERITELAERQRAKGMSKYGFGLEMNTADIIERINHLQEELIDGLMYCEWIKGKLGAGHE